jgi:hypothetical protein
VPSRRSPGSTFGYCSSSRAKTRCLVWTARLQRRRLCQRQPSDLTAVWTPGVEAATDYWRDEASDFEPWLRAGDCRATRESSRPHEVTGPQQHHELRNPWMRKSCRVRAWGVTLGGAGAGLGMRGRAAKLWMRKSCRVRVWGVTLGGAGAGLGMRGRAAKLWMRKSCTGLL